MKKSKREHICIAVFKDGHCYGASEPMWKSEVIDMIKQAKDNNVDAVGLDLNILFDEEFGDLEFETNFIFEEDSRSYVLHCLERSE